MYIEPTTKIWVTFDQKETSIVNIIGTRATEFLLPMNPEKIDIKGDASQDSFRIIGKGQITVPQHGNLRKFSWNGFFPGIETPYTGAFLPPEYYINIFENARQNGTIGRLKIYTNHGQIDCPVIVKSFNTHEEGGNIFDVSYSVELIEWKDYSPRTLKVDEKEKTATEQPKKRTPKAGAVTVGAKVIANGKYFYDSYGSKPFGTAKNLSTEITRIVEHPKNGQDYPVHIGKYGWTKLSNLQVK